MSFPAIGFPAQPRQDLMSRLISQLRSRSDTARQELVTGRLADPANILNGKVSEILGVEQSLAEVGQYREIIGIASARASAFQGSLSVLSDLSVDLQVSGQTALDTRLDVASRAVSVSARQALDAAVSALNVSFGGRRLFAGDAGGTPALATADIIDHDFSVSFCDVGGSTIPVECSVTRFSQRERTLALIVARPV